MPVGDLTTQFEQRLTRYRPRLSSLVVRGADLGPTVASRIEQLAGRVPVTFEWAADPPMTPSVVPPGDSRSFQSGPDDTACVPPASSASHAAGAQGDGDAAEDVGLRPAFRDML